MLCFLVLTDFKTRSYSSGVHIENYYSELCCRKFFFPFRCIITGLSCFTVSRTPQVLYKGIITWHKVLKSIGGLLNFWLGLVCRFKFVSHTQTQFFGLSKEAPYMCTLYMCLSMKHIIGLPLVHFAIRLDNNSACDVRMNAMPPWVVHYMHII